MPHRRCPAAVCGGLTLTKLDELIQMLESCRADFEKAKGGNKAAGTRVRKTMQDVKTRAQEIRQEMLETRDPAEG